MAEFQPILVKTDRAVPYKEGQMIVCSVASQPPSANNWVPGVYVDLNGTRQMLTMQGPQGERGQQGIPGATGAKGDPGKDGAPGKDGKQGPAGPQGIQGVRGLMGPKGENGGLGPQGGQGEQGPKGDKGDPGPGIKAWYHSVAEMEADFATSTILKGELAAINSEDTAEDGRVYVKGTAAWEYWITMRGMQGPKGDQGIQGPMGAQGPQGRGFNWAGGWTAAETYALDDVVEYNGALHICLNSTTAGDEPGVSDKWQVMVPPAPQGPPGPMGPQGPISGTQFVDETPNMIYEDNNIRGEISQKYDYLMISVEGFLCDNELNEAVGFIKLRGENYVVNHQITLGGARYDGYCAAHIWIKTEGENISYGGGNVYRTLISDTGTTHEVFPLKYMRGMMPGYKNVFRIREVVGIKLG